MTVPTQAPLVKAKALSARLASSPLRVAGPPAPPVPASHHSSRVQDGDVLAPPGPARIALAGQRLHFVGIGCCGMSGLARLTRQQGAICTGSDHAPSETIDALVVDGFDVALEQNANTIPADCDALVISAAIRDEHPEIVEAKRRGIAVIKYARLLGQLMLGRTGVAVAGTHGKSTTTSVLSHCLITAGLDPSVIVGAHCEQIGGGYRCGDGKQSDILVAEACEFDRSFHNFHPSHAIILNVEEDHLDVYGSLDAIIESFHVFAQKLPEHGTLLVNHEMPWRAAVTQEVACTVETIGFSPDADWHVEARAEGQGPRAEGIGTNPKSEIRNPKSPSAKGQGPRAEGAENQKSEIRNQKPLSRLYHHGQLVCEWSNPLPGEHMAYNAAAAAVTAHRLGADWANIATAIENFRGLDRRMQLIGKRAVSRGEITIVDDYGHHPTEVAATLLALRHHHQPKRLVCVFQPHQHSRTRFLLEQFAASFSEADVVIVPDIYFVRDSLAERHAVTAGDLVDRLRRRGVSAMHLYPFDAIVEQLRIMTRPGDLVVTMGAGDVWKIARKLMT